MCVCLNLIIVNAMFCVLLQCSRVEHDHLSLRSDTLYRIDEKEVSTLGYYVGTHKSSRVYALTPPHLKVEVKSK